MEQASLEKAPRYFFLELLKTLFKPTSEVPLPPPSPQW